MGVIRIPTLGLLQKWNKMINVKHLAQTLPQCPNINNCYCFWLFFSLLGTDAYIPDKFPSRSTLLRFYDTGMWLLPESNYAAQNIKFGLRLTDSLSISLKWGCRAGQSRGWLIEVGWWPISLFGNQWEGKRWFIFCFLFTGQGRTIALGLRDEMNRTHTLMLCQNLRSWASEYQLVSYVELFYWCLRKYNHW